MDDIIMLSHMTYFKNISLTINLYFHRLLSHIKNVSPQYSKRHRLKWTVIDMTNVYFWITLQMLRDFAVHYSLNVLNPSDPLSSSFILCWL